ncbi:MAG: hypothetical protein IPM45_12160 [Acidimicrobiales bacterium]|nr:hypothetical protein [Acidimicrobiales bacterium]
MAPDERPPPSGGTIVLLVVAVALVLLLVLQAASWVAGVFWNVVRLGLVVLVAYLVVRWFLSRSRRA